MQKSIFIKYFSLCASIIIVSITLLGAILLVFAAQYFKAEKKELLTQNVTKVATDTMDSYQSHGKIEPNDVLATYRIYGSAIKATFFLVDKLGNAVIFDEHDTELPLQNGVPRSIMQNLGGSFYELGTLGGLYDKEYYTVAIPLEMGGTAEYYVFASMCATAINDFLQEIFKMFLLSSLVVILGVFIIVYYVSLSMVRPLREMSIAAQQFGQGNFSKRLPVRNNNEIGQLAQSLNDMASSLCNLESMRRSFVANVSHELKTPMTTIAGFIDGILDGTIPKSQQRQYLGIVSDEVKRLSRLVRSMLNLAKIEAGEMTLQKANLNILDSICQTVFIFERGINEKHLDIRGLDHDKVMVECDADLIHQVLYNLIENAVKFVNEDGYIEFSFGNEGNKTVVSVKNSGTGLSKEEISKVFERFYKTDKSRGLDKNGVGLGLNIVRTIIHLHGGDISVNSVQGEYTEFVFTIATGAPHHKDKGKKELDA